MALIGLDHVTIFTQRIDETVEFFESVPDDFDGLVERLQGRSVRRRVADQPETGLRQVFFREPNGTQIEVTCPA